MTGTRCLHLRLVAIDPPFKTVHGVLFGLQSGREVVDPVPAVKTTVFNTVIQIVDTASRVDFKGGHVHGKRGDRFLYLSWGLPDPSEPYVMFARAKIKLTNIPAHLVDLATHRGHVLVCDLEATNGKGEPATGTIKEAAISWRVEPHQPAAS